MAKVINITDKLTFEVNPIIQINGKEVQVNADAPTMLKLLEVMDSGESESKTIIKAYELLFNKKSREVLDSLKLSFTDLMTVVSLAMELVKGDVKTSGEA